MVIFGQRVPVQESEPAYCYGFRSKQIVESREVAVVLGVFDKMKVEVAGEYENFIARVQVLKEWGALLQQNSANWLRIYWSPAFAQEVEQASKDLRFEAIADQLPLLHFCDIQSDDLSKQYLDADRAVGVEVSGTFVYALFGDGDEQVPLDCGHSVMATTVRSRLPKHFQHASLALTHACEVCFKETTLGRIVKVLNRKEFVKISLPCARCSAKATFHFSCGCSVCDEHVLAFSVFEEDELRCGTHIDRSFTIPERQLLFALYNSLRPLAEFRTFPRQFQTHCKNNHEQRAEADYVLHELCCLCAHCIYALNNELKAEEERGAQPAKVKCPLCCAWVYAIQQVQMGMQNFELNLNRMSSIPTGACCIMCSTYSNIKVKLLCDHFLCLNCISSTQQIGMCLCSQQLREDDFRWLNRVMQDAVHYTEKSPHCECYIATDQFRQQIEKREECFRCRKPLTDIDVLYLKYQLILFDVRD